MSKEKEMDKTDQNLIEFGKRIKKARQILGLNQQDFADKIGILGSTLSDIEKGKTKATFYTFFNISNRTYINLKYLLNNEEPIIKKPTKPTLQDVCPDLEPDSNIDFLVECLQIPIIKHSMLVAFLKCKREFDEFIQEFYKNQKEKHEYLNQSKS
jgi:transcriptional regulator with XRE-family HTH domain